MQAKHLWYNLDIRWVDLKDKLEVLAPTGLTRDDIWRHLFLTKQRKNPYEEGCYTGEDLEDVKRKWEAKKEYFLQYKKDGSRPPCIDLAMALQGFDIENTAFFFSSLAERAITAVPVTALQKEAIVTSSAMPRFHQAETKNKGRQHKKQPSKTNNTTPTKHKPKTKHLSGNRAAYSCTTYN